MSKNHSGVHLWLILWKAYDAMQANAEQSIASLGMCLSDFGILELVLHKGPRPVSAIGARLGLTSGSMTTAVDRLESRGLVERRDDEHDRRAKIVHLTPGGRRLITQAFADHESHLEELVRASLSQREGAMLERLLKKLGTGAATHLNTLQGSGKQGRTAPSTRRSRRGGV